MSDVIERKIQEAINIVKKIPDPYHNIAFGVVLRHLLSSESNITTIRHHKPEFISTVSNDQAGLDIMLKSDYDCNPWYQTGCIEDQENQTTTQDQSNTPIDLTTEKGIAQAWSENKISDSQFLSAYQKLIDNGTIVPFSGVSKGNGTDPIPDWIKNEAGLWYAEKIDDNTYRQVLQHLFTNGYLHNP